MSLRLNNAQQIHHNVQEVWLELEKIRNYIQASGPLQVNVYRSWRILEKAGKPCLYNYSSQSSSQIRHVSNCCSSNWNRIKISSNPQEPHASKKVYIAKDHKICSVSVHCTAEVRWTGPAMSPRPNAGRSVDSSVAWLDTMHMENRLHWVRGDGLLINRVRCLGRRQGERDRGINRSDGFIEMHMVRRGERTESLNHSLRMIIMTGLQSQLTDVFQKASWFQSKSSCFCPCDCIELPVQTICILNNL